jgi:adenosine deaminase
MKAACARMCVAFYFLIFATAIQAQMATKSAAASSEAELRAGRAFKRARDNKADTLALEAFLKKMPKGADLHMHLSGAVYAETFIRDAAEDGLCVNPSTLSFVKTGGSAAVSCENGNVTSASVFKNQKLYDELIDSFSMRGFVPTPGVTGHDQFFATFDRFGGINKRHTGEWLDEVASRAAVQNEQYLEIMITPDFSDAAKLGYSLGWPETNSTQQNSFGDATGTSPAQLAQLRSQLVAGGLEKEVDTDIQELNTALADRSRIEHCGESNAAPACSVKIRFLYQVLRAFPPQQVFAQTLLGFEVVRKDPNVVGLNFVQPEDAYMAMSEYNREMHMLDYLHGVYPKVHISLHAGELAPGLVPPQGTSFHIREAVELGHAERIGHGVDVMYETDPEKLLHEMAERHVMVEINLTSNAVILGVVPPYHPLPEYRQVHVPVALSTDDEGVSRIDLTHEYTRASLEYGLTYRDLKDMARTSIEHSFLPGASLWSKPDNFTHIRPECVGHAASTSPSGACAAFLKSNEKAAEQWELEYRFAAFESSIH